MNGKLTIMALAGLLVGCEAQQRAATEEASAVSDTVGTGLTRRERRTSVYLRADSDGDGAVTRAEIEREATQRFARLDKDGDGTFSAAEIAATPGYARGSERGENRRGPLTREEHVSRALRRFDRRDRNDDGRLSDEELSPAR
ncbi:MAG TPA: hypothetical protein VF592_05510 [Sphingomonas sp.]|jgi:hypothetical protein|uniref:hypothetical protein n=1 Tax=Sphingomonas sp. TaxID=28214 RepID=UPI002ED8C40C